MGRIAGDNPYYSFRLVKHVDPELDPHGRYVTVTDEGFELPSVTHIINKVLAKPATAMAWWGYREAIKGVTEEWFELEDNAELTEEGIENHIRSKGYDPMQSLRKAGERGSWAHDALELLLQGHESWVTDMADYEFHNQGTRFVEAVMNWHADILKDIYIGESFITGDILSEVPVFSLEGGYAGTADLLIPTINGWIVGDLKTHKPAAGFTLSGRGPAYLSDLLQVQAYRTAVEETRGVTTCGSLVIVARDNGEYVEDKRTIPHEMWDTVLDLFKQMRAEGWTP